MTEPHEIHRRQRPGAAESSTPVAVVTAIDAVLRDSLVASLLLDVPGAVALRYEVDVESVTLRRLVLSADGIAEDEEVVLEHPCASCAMREDAVPALNRLASDPRISVILLAPPISADPSIVAGTLAPHQRAWHLASASTVLSAESLHEDLLGDATLAERQLQWAEGDERSVGEALAAQIEYSGLLVLDADGPSGADGEAATQRVAAGRELLEHLRAPDQLLAVGLHDLESGSMHRGALDHQAALLRRDSRVVEPYGGPSAHGTWTLDLHSERPFHPDRLLENIEALGGGRLRSRGRFWVPDRPDTICQWDGAGGQVSIGATWKTGRELPTTRLVVTGVEAADAERVRAAFRRSLLTEDEWATGLEPWMGAEDPLAPWLGERGVLR
ncbi:GTP-binding protein [Brachybacterium sp. GCM10030252]|uniref:GTP-binding protein n=1 Tax=Brachybacterium sp. GCM10030252 TaxID=3273380 RepID=UPI0036198D3F